MMLELYQNKVFLKIHIIQPIKSHYSTHSTVYPFSTVLNYVKKCFKETFQEFLKTFPKV